MKSIFKVMTLALVLILGLSFLNDDIYATNQTATSVTLSQPLGWGTSGAQKFTVNMASNYTAIDTAYLPFTLTSTMDSVDLIILTRPSRHDSSINLQFRFEQSPNNLTWKTTTLGTDSTTWGASAFADSTLAGAVVNRISIGYLRYGTYPYNRLKIMQPVKTGTAAKARIDVYVIPLKSKNFGQ